MIGEVDQQRLLMARLDGAKDLPQIAQADDHLEVGVEQIDRIDHLEPTAVFIYHNRALRLPKPTVDKAAVSIDQSVVGQVKIYIQLRKEELIIAQLMAQIIQGLAKRRAVAYAVNVWVMSQ